MKIEVWSDFSCPFCYIGKQKLEQALETFPEKDSVMVEFKSFQLDPNAEPYNGQDYFEALAAKFGSMEKVKQMTENMKEHAKNVGLDFHFDRMKPTNTFKAHRLAHFSKQHEKENEVIAGLFHAHFTAGKDIHNDDVLSVIANAAGLEKDAVTDVLENDEAFKHEAAADIQEAQTLQITGVPFFVFDRKYAISGAQPAEVFTQTLEKTLSEAG